MKKVNNYRQLKSTLAVLGLLAALPGCFGSSQSFDLLRICVRTESTSIVESSNLGVEVQFQAVSRGSEPILKEGRFSFSESIEPGGGPYCSEYDFEGLPAPSPAGIEKLGFSDFDVLNDPEVTIEPPQGNAIYTKAAIESLQMKERGDLKVKVINLVVRF